MQSIKKNKMKNFTEEVQSRTLYCYAQNSPLAINIIII